MDESIKERRNQRRDQSTEGIIKKGEIQRREIIKGGDN